MNPINASLCTLAVLALCTPAWAANKCTGADGKVSFQDVPCVGKSEQLNIRQGAPLSPAAAGAVDVPGKSKPQSEAQRLDAITAASVKERKLYELQSVDYPVSLKIISDHRQACEAEQVRLKQGQFTYVQNLYGKTHAAQMASEMAAASARCDLKDRQLKEQSDSVKAECMKFGGCKS